jgi:CDP-glucose 4,6-dehydratase
LFGTIYKNKRVFLTGHTGFKGSWLALWLQQLGAEVVGYALAPNTNPNHFDLLNLSMKSHIGDIADLTNLQKAMTRVKPDIVFHLAAQPLVRYSYREPIETYRTNVMGTANVLEAIRFCQSVKATVIITTDKCYENLEQAHGYVETDKMGGYDPYSSSKGCAELVTNAYRNSYFNLSKFNDTHQTLVASARAGNVIGGGDWCEDRLIPDLIRGVVTNQEAVIRYPKATRPWQHVLEPLSGYLLLGEKLLSGGKEFAEGWNFGPELHDVLTVEDVLKLAKEAWKSVQYRVEQNKENPHEAGLLSLDISKAKEKLGWQPKWNAQTSIQKTFAWYQQFYENQFLLTLQDIADYKSLRN